MGYQEPQKHYCIVFPFRLVLEVAGPIFYVLQG